MKIINLTPHEVKVLNTDGEVVQSFPSEGVVRCQVTRQQEGEVNGIPINRTVFGEVEGLPEPQDDVVYIVSAIVAQAAKDRGDLVIPDDAVRDEQGRIVGCRAFARV